MRKILLLLLAFVSLTLTLKAQTQSLEDLKLQLEQTDTLYEAEKYDEVLEICLSIGRSTERCDSEQERTVYVRSQILGAPDKPCGVGRADANPKLLLNDT